MVKNSEIIKELVSNYIETSNKSNDQTLVLDAVFYQAEKKGRNIESVQDKLFNWDNLDLFDEKGIQLVILGDNPGKTEMKYSRYFNETGQAGRHARTFIEFARHIESGKELNLLILNKTPFFSAKTDKLKFDSTVKKSVNHTIDALNRLAESNGEIKILIVGYAKNDLNTYFYKKLHEEMTPELRSKTYFAKHFSNGHFMEQLVRGYIENKKTDVTPSLATLLGTMGEETIAKISKNHKTQF